MWKISPQVCVFLLGLGVVHGTVTCPDGERCTDFQTCCETKQGYACCAYPNAVCCPDMAHCCPPGFRCNLVTQNCEREAVPWMSFLPLKRVSSQEPLALVHPLSPLQPASSDLIQGEGRERSSVVYCDTYHTCPDGTTCCRHPTGVWFCCPISPARCCLDGYHCCPLGFDCDYTYTRCVRQSIPYPFNQHPAPPSIPAARISQSQEALVTAALGKYQTGKIRCDNKSYCPPATSCCQQPGGQWGCCPFPLGQCCEDGVHCCEYGYKCDLSTLTCKKGQSQIPARLKENAKQIKMP